VQLFSARDSYVRFWCRLEVIRFFAVGKTEVIVGTLLPANIFSSKQRQKKKNQTTTLDKKEWFMKINLDP
jgi:hypothetical protein